MLITIRSPFLMFLCGWGQYPSYVTASRGLWWLWFKRGRHQ